MHAGTQANARMDMQQDMDAGMPVRRVICPPLPPAAAAVATACSPYQQSKVAGAAAAGALSLCRFVGLVVCQLIGQSVSHVVWSDCRIRIVGRWLAGWLTWLSTMKEKHPPYCLDL